MADKLMTDYRSMTAEIITRLCIRFQQHALRFKIAYLPGVDRFFDQTDLLPHHNRGFSHDGGSERLKTLSNQL